MSKPVSLSHGEKLILLMLCEVYDHLKIDGQISQNLIREAIYSGNLWGLGWGMTGVFDNTETPETVVSETVDILMMWRRLEESYEVLTPAARDEYDALMSDFPQSVRFEGFDNNYETTHIGAARFLIDQLGRFKNFKGRSLEAHMPTIEAHRRMWTEFSVILKEVSNGDFRADQIAAVMLARIPPERRGNT